MLIFFWLVAVFFHRYDDHRSNTYFRRMHLLEVSNVSREEQGRTVLSSLSFAMDAGDRLAIAGATGSGKTTLLKIIGGLLQPTGGSVFFDQQKVKGPQERLLPGHPSIAYLSQYFELRNNYYVQVLLEISNKVGEKAAADIYRICQVDHLLQRRTNQLSGGERQRIALAGVLTTQPRLLLLDEPFSNADLQHRLLLKQVLNDINQQLHTAMILVAHDPADVLPWAQQLMILDEGRLVQKGAPAEVYRQPVNEYVAALTGLYNLLPPSLSRKLGLGAPQGTALTIARPEQLHCSYQNPGTPALVRGVDFMGAHCIVTVDAEGQLLRIFSMQHEWRIGAQVFVTATSKK